MTTTPENPAETPRPIGPPDRYRGHEFEYENTTDLFRCVYCTAYEVSARGIAKNANDPAGITACPGLPTWQADGADRVALAVTLIPQAATAGAWGVGVLSSAAMRTGLGRSMQFGYRDNVMLIETSPSVADQLAAGLRDVEHPDRVSGPMVVDITRLTAEETRERLANNYAAYVAKHGEPRR